jgi:hypothetical protein
MKSSRLKVLFFSGYSFPFISRAATSPMKLRFSHANGSIRPTERTFGASREYQNYQSSFRHNGPRNLRRHCNLIFPATTNVAAITISTAIQGPVIVCQRSLKTSHQRSKLRTSKPATFWNRKQLLGTARMRDQWKHVELPEREPASNYLRFTRPEAGPDDRSHASLGSIG